VVVNKNNKIVAFVGLAGSGKTEAAEYVVSKGYPKVDFGDVVLDAMQEAGIEHIEENEKKFREELREKEGKDVVAKRIIPQIHDLFNAGQHRVVAEDLYSWTEYKTMKKEFPGELTVVAMVAPKRLRHRRLEQRPIRPLTQPEADSRDWAEIENLEKGGPIAIADYYIENGADLDDLHRKVDELLNEIEFYHEA
jgi:dephospho-CoA kinase